MWFFLFNGAIVEIQGGLEYKVIRAGTFQTTVALDILPLANLVFSHPKLQARYHTISGSKCIG